MSHIYDITTFSMLDYPGELSCIVWMSGCNLRCVYCHNPEIVFSKGRKEDAELLNFLETRKGKLTAVVFSGGEATFCPSLPDLVRQAKDMGFKTKLDTNGSNPKVLKELIGAGLLDYVALDYKCPPYQAEKLLGTNRFHAAFDESLDFLIAESRAGRVMLEIRTTVPPDFMTEADIAWIIADLEKRGYQGTYWLQNIVTTGENTIGNIPAPSRTFDLAQLPTPKGFTLGFRNFK
ncbi:MAG: anaerobic ribonucleoside-triphosphate reductase activating protein [Alphaproteobacteria bacterium]|nr:anaerobic ribonucleoside-triphosphate reductase activating protein [Alphaproteobacteria bacterium]